VTGSLSDTHPDIEAMQIRLLRDMPVWQKLKTMFEMSQLVRTLALEGLRERHPEASEGELRWRLCELLYGRDLTERAYGPPPWEENPPDA
jgi:hypothetical protein